MRRLRGERGDAAVELVVLTPLVVVMLLFVVFTGRLVAARGDVAAAARDAARAATLARTAPAASASALAAAQATLGGGLAPCQSTDIAVALGGFTPGGTVTASVACEVDLADLGLIGVPGTSRVTGDASAVIDAYRGTDDG